MIDASKKYTTQRWKSCFIECRSTQQSYIRLSNWRITSTGGSRVFIFDHTIRRPNPTAAHSDDERRPVKRAHIDQSEWAAMNQVTRHLGEDAPRLLQSRFQLINVWRPIKTIYKDPLAVCDSHSVPDADILAVKLIYPDWVGEPCTILPNTNHRWYYKNQQTPEEVMLFKCYDWKTDGRARRVPHAAFTDPEMIEKDPRQSIEVRALVFHEDDLIRSWFPYSIHTCWHLAPLWSNLVQFCCPVLAACALHFGVVPFSSKPEPPKNIENILLVDLMPLACQI